MLTELKKTLAAELFYFIVKKLTIFLDLKFFILLLSK
jgi:hypothetical protein